MDVFVLIKQEAGEIEEVLSFDNRNNAVNHVLNVYREYDYNDKVIEEIKKTLNEDDYLTDNYGNDSLIWHIYQTKI